jgi:hypothetical protein
MLFAAGLFLGWQLQACRAPRTNSRSYARGWADARASWIEPDSLAWWAGYEKGKADGDTIYSYGPHGIAEGARNLSISHCSFRVWTVTCSIPMSPPPRVFLALDSLSSDAVVKGAHFSTVILP